MSDERFLSLGDVAARLSVSEQTVRRWVKAHKLKAYKPGLEWRIAPEDLQEFLESRSSPKESALSSPEPTLWNGISEEQRAQGYPWMGDALPRLIARWERDVEERSNDGFYMHVVGIACIDTARAILRFDVPGKTLQDRVPEAEVEERVLVVERLFELCNRAQAHYRASDVFDETQDRKASHLRAELVRRTREIA